MIKVPGYSSCMSLHQWFLTLKTSDEKAQLFILVDVNPNNIFYFFTNNIYKEEAIQWINELPNLIRIKLTFDQQCEICKNDNENPLRSYCNAAPAKHTSDSVRGFGELLKGDMDMVNDKEKEDFPDTDKDHLRNCWKAPPRL
eukprot:15337725-Ditylum_brightwellii.AAC.1